MIIVTGTKRSGTSMWMQILRAAKIPVVGEEFSGIWKETIYEANPHGFFESRFRRGIYYGTNPHPKTGDFLHPGAVRTHAVKVFVPGLCRSDLAYIGRVVGTVRHWREYGTSLGRLFGMEADALAARTGKPRVERPRLEPLLEWWLENFMLIRDIATRRYPARLISYARVVEEPGVWIPKMLDWLGTGDKEAAVAAVDPQVRTAYADDEPTPDLADEHRAAFDLLYAAAHDGIPLNPPELERLNQVHAELIGKIEAQLAEVRRFEARRRAAAQVAKMRAKVADGPSEEGPVPAEKIKVPSIDTIDGIDMLVNPERGDDDEV